MKNVIHHMDPLTDDYAIYAPLPVRIEHRDPYLEPVSLKAVRGIMFGVALGVLGWVLLFSIIYFVETSL